MANKAKLLRAPLTGSIVQSGATNGGHVYWVKQRTASDFNLFYEKHFVKYDNGNSSVYTTIQEAVNAAKASVGDVIYVSEGYAETISAAAGTTLNKAGVAVIGLGVGNTRPTITFGTAVTASLDITADNCKFMNFIGVANIDGLTKPFLVSGNNCELDIEWQDGSSTVEAETVVRLDTADNSILKLKYNGFTAGNAAVRVVAIDDCDNVRINIDGYGVVSTAWVNMVDAASTNVLVSGVLFTQGVTNGSRDVVDTITGSTWFGTIADMSAGKVYSGGSAQAWASTDVTGLAAAIDAVDNFVDTEVASILTASGAVADAALADTIEGAAATTQSMITDVKGVLQRIGADSANNTAATTNVVANDDGSILERLEGIKQGIILARGTFTTSSATVPADTGRTEANDYWNGCYLVPMAGAILGQARQIVDFANTGGVFTLDTDIPFTAVPGTVAYIIVPGPGYIAPTIDSSADATPSHILGRKTDSAAYTPASTKSVAAYAKGTADLQERVVKKTAATMVNGQTLFTIAGGPIQIFGLTSICETANDGTASTLQYNVAPTSGSPTTVSGASASLASAAAGASVTLAGTALATAALLSAGGPNLIANPGTIMAPAGTITAIIGVGSTTGTWAHYLRYKPLAVNVTVT